jgi:hypothetical protein
MVMTPSERLMTRLGVTKKAEPTVADGRTAIWADRARSMANWAETSGSIRHRIVGSPPRRVRRSGPGRPATGSTPLCTPASLSQEVGLALGAPAGAARIRDVVIARALVSSARRPGRRSTSSSRRARDRRGPAARVAPGGQPIGYARWRPRARFIFRKNGGARSRVNDRRDLVRPDRTSDEFFEPVTELIAQELCASVSVGDQLDTVEEARDVAAVIAEAVLDRFVVRPRPAARPEHHVARADIAESSVILDVRDLSVAYGAKTAVESVSFRIARGEIFGSWVPMELGRRAR